MCRDITFSNALVVQNIFVSKGRMEIFVGVERIFCLGLGREGCDVNWRDHALGKVHSVT